MQLIKLIIVLTSIVLVCVNNTKAQNSLTLEDIWLNGKYAAESIDGLTSMKDGEHYTTLENEKGSVKIVKWSYQTGKEMETIVSSKDLKNAINGEEIIFSAYEFDATETKLLLTTNKEKLYRHSFVAAYFVYDLKTKKLSALDDVIKQQLPAFSPAGDKVAFVQNNNIYVKDLATNSIKQLTNDGRKNQIINGTTDWVYEEEFGFDRAFFWNENGTMLAYYKFDESSVKEFNMQTYGTLYPKDNKFKYPKAGEDNSKVDIYIYNVITGATQKANIKDVYEYIPRIAWTKDNNTLCISTMNRKQNNLKLLLVDASSGASNMIYEQQSNEYVDINESAANFFFFLNDKKHFILQSDRDGFMHLYLYDINGKLKNQITKGNWDVKDYLGIDEKNKTVYYTSTEVSPMEQHTYCVQLDGTKKNKLTSQIGFNTTNFSATFNYYINTYTSVNTPVYAALYNKQGKEIRVLQDNKALRDNLAKLNLAPKEFFTFTTTDNVSLNGWMIKPQNFDAIKKYPVFMTFYGGPGHNEVENKWGGNNYLWHQLLAQKGYLIVCVDNRGTGGRGNVFKKSTYKQLGKLELQDQIETAKYLGSQPYVDKNRIGVMGWSFGGYLASLCMTKGADYFKTGIAVAPVTNWKYYDSIYTERFLQTPQQNKEGYEDNSPINFVDKLKGPYLLVHGSADDNVHCQNTMEMTTALVKANKQFDQFIYPDKAHSIAGAVTKLHLYTKMTDFILRNL